MVVQAVVPTDLDTFAGRFAPNPRSNHVTLKVRESPQVRSGFVGISATVRKTILAHTPHREQDLELDQRFSELGIDQPLLATIVSELEATFGVRIVRTLPVTVVVKLLVDCISKALEEQENVRYLDVFAACYEEVAGITSSGITLSTPVADLRLTGLMQFDVCDLLRDEHGISVTDYALVNSETVYDVILHLKEVVRDALCVPIAKGA